MLQLKLRKIRNSWLSVSLRGVRFYHPHKYGNPIYRRSQNHLRASSRLDVAGNVTRVSKLAKLRADLERCAEGTENAGVEIQARWKMQRWRMWEWKYRELLGGVGTKEGGVVHSLKYKGWKDLVALHSPWLSATHRRNSSRRPVRVLPTIHDWPSYALDAGIRASVVEAPTEMVLRDSLNNTDGISVSSHACICCGSQTVSQSAYQEVKGFLIA